MVMERSEPMRRVALSVVMAAVAMVLAGCHDRTQSPPASESPASKPGAAQSNPSAAVAGASVVIQPAMTPPKHGVSKSAQQIAQLDLNSEGGVRDGNYAMWVHVVQAGKPIPNLNVVAFDADHKAVAAARTNEDGDAMLKVHITSYRITVSRGREHAEQEIVFRPGDQVELDLKP
jgi:hypothetical protein